MSKYADIEQIKEVIRTEWVKYMPSDLDINLSFVLGKIAEVPTIEVSVEELRKKYKDFYEQGKIDAMLEVSEDCISRADAINAYNEAVDELVKAEMEEFNLGDFTECSFNTTQLKLIARKIENAPSVALLQADVVMERLDFVKKIIETHIDDALCGLFFTRNLVGDRMVLLDKRFGIDIEICCEYSYFEIFGLTDYEQKVIESFYDGLSAARRNK